MKIGELCNRKTIVVYPDNSLHEAAKLMRQNHVGSVVVVSKSADRPRPVGMITDRDIVVEIVAEEIGIDRVTVKDIMSMPPVIARENDDTFKTLESMCENGIRRIPVVDQMGYLVGIFTTDDLLKLIASRLNKLVLLIQHERYVEETTRSNEK